MKYWRVVLILGLASCATSPKFEQPAPPQAKDAQVLAEQATEQKMAYDRYLKLADAVWRVGDKLSVANADLCRSRNRIGYEAGLHIGTLATTEKLYRSAALARFPQIGDKATVLYVDSGSPADRAGIEDGDIVVAVDDEAIPGNDSAASKITEEFNEGSGRAVRVTVLRGAQTITKDIASVAACDYAMGLVDGRQVNSYTDDHGIHIYEGMAQLLRSDDELAVIIGHEMAHNICGHIDGNLGTTLALTFGGNGSVVPVEEQADYVGLYLMARAGYDINAAPELWRRLAATAMPEAITHATDHPPFPVRVVMLTREISEIRAKEARGLPLIPNGVLTAETTGPIASSLAAR